MSDGDLTMPIGHAGMTVTPRSAAAAVAPLRAVNGQVAARTTPAAGAPRT